MRNTTIGRLGGLTLAALLLVPALPAGARDNAPGTALQLDLRAALEAQGSDFATALEVEPVGRDERTAGPEIRVSELRAEAWALDEGPADTPRPDQRGFGRWLKKRWYVPVLAAVVLAVALDSGDDDASGEED